MLFEKAHNMNDKETINTNEFIGSLLTSSIIVDPYRISTGFTANNFTISNSTSAGTWPVIDNRQEWIDAFPEWSTVQEMTKIYPAIENALKNLQTTYALVKDDYEARKKIK